MIPNPTNLPKIPRGWGRISLAGWKAGDRYFDFKSRTWVEIKNGGGIYSHLVIRRKA